MCSLPEATTPGSSADGEVVQQEPGPSREPLVLLMEVVGNILRFTSHAQPTMEEEWDKAQRDLVTSISTGIAKAHAVERMDIEENWARLHQALERCRLAEKCSMARCQAARTEAREIRESATAEAEEILAKAPTEVEEIQA
jgi:hypothetical protein